MGIQELEQKLQGRQTYGFVTPTASPDYLGWILVKRRLGGPLTLEDVEPGSDDYAALLNLSEEYPEVYMGMVEENHDVQERPFMVLEIELERRVHESGVYPESEDYRKREVNYFHSLQEVEQFLNGSGYSIANIQNHKDIDAP